MVDSQEDGQKPSLLVGGPEDISIKADADQDERGHRDTAGENEMAISKNEWENSPSQQPLSDIPSPTKTSHTTPSRSPTKPSSLIQSPSVKMETMDGEMLTKRQSSKAAKLRVPTKPPKLFLDYPDATGEATKSFSLITESIFANKWIGRNPNENGLECDCDQEWGKLTNDMSAFH